MHVKFLKVCEAISLIVQSVIYPTHSITKNKPTIIALKNGHKFRMVHVDCEVIWKTESLEYRLFGEVNYLFIFIKLYNINLLNYFSDRSIRTKKQ